MFTLIKIVVEFAAFSATLAGGGYLGILAQEKYPTQVAAVLAFFGKKSS
jgi:hypothetical protein